MEQGSFFLFMLLVWNELLKFSVCKGYVGNVSVCKGSIGNVTISNEEWMFLGGDLYNSLCICE